MEKMEKKGLISVPVATAVGLGAIIGAGIFVLSGTAIALAGADALVAFVIVGIVAIILALEMGELSSIMPDVKGAAYSYTFKAFGSRLGFITGIFIYLALAISISVVALGFGAYLSSILGISVGTYSIPFAIVLIAILAVVNLLGVKKAARADSILVVIKILILLIFIGFAILVAFSGVGTGAASHFTFDISTGGLEGIFAASIAIFFAYSGFQSIATFSSRIKGGGTGAAKAILAAVLISLALYVLVVFALLLLLPPTSYTVSADPLTFALTSAGAPSWLLLLVGIGALIATTSAALALILSASRSVYQMSVDGLLPKILMSYNEKKGTAENGVILSAVIAVIMLFAGSIYLIVSIVMFSLMFDYLLVGFDIIHFRRLNSKPDFKMPLYPYLPVLGILILISFFAVLPIEVLGLGVGMFIFLVILYQFLSRSKKKIGMDIRLF